MPQSLHTSGFEDSSARRSRKPAKQTGETQETPLGLSLAALPNGEGWEQGLMRPGGLHPRQKGEPSKKARPGEVARDPSARFFAGLRG